MVASNVVSKATGSGAGSACSSPSMRNRSVASSLLALSISDTFTLINRGSNRRIVASTSARSTSRRPGSFIAPAVKSGMPKPIGEDASSVNSAGHERQ